VPGSLKVGQNAYQVYGASKDGNYLVYGSIAGPKLENVYVLSTNDQAPTGSISFSSDNGALNSIGTVCFVEGTLIRTSAGERRVEDLIVGDYILTASGHEKIVRWVGCRPMKFWNVERNLDTLPICISKDAFGPGKPSQDLHVSPGHAIAFDILGSVLIPAKSLINGSTIYQTSVESTKYYHIELDEHAVIIANGIMAESYIDMNNRGFFSNSSVVDTNILPDGDIKTLSDYCAPYHRNGEIVDAVRTRIDHIAVQQGWAREDAASFNLHLLVNDRLIFPQITGMAAKFIIDEIPEKIEIVSEKNIPAFISNSGDGRTLGVDIGRITITDGLQVSREILMNDARLSEGFHDFEEQGSHRWTNGTAFLPSSLFEGTQGAVMLTIHLASNAVPRWSKKVATAKAVVTLAA